MALQHFYSRVPARVSMYNKSDGFDTFAHSEGLEREFIERELTVVYENKLSKNDVSMARRGEIPPIYCQCRLRSGKLVQSCVSYLSLDYTGERSAYLAHSLVLTDEERQRILSDKDCVVFNKDMFVTDISSFDITATNASPDSKYPDCNYVAKSIDSVHGIASKYEPETVKSFIYAVLLSLCGKGKNVYFKLPGNNYDLSEESLDFINEIMTILPYSMRESLSFVSYVNDYTQYSSCKLKGVSANCSEVSTAKGVFFDFQTNLIVGLLHDEVVANKILINFFYSLLENNELRCEFLSYVRRAVDAVPSLLNMNLKTLTDLVFLFRQSSGLFPEQAILPNDQKVYDFFCVYEKYRSALSDEYRMKAYKCLSRYPQRHEAIPKNIFAKVMRLYSTEIKPAKRIAMNVALELIHTDIMREKLFVFIRNNYDGEDEDIKDIIIDDLCRVFYGGFLQINILEFFSRIFADEPSKSKDKIVEKLLLSIRTVAIQQKILEFINLHYDEFNDNNKLSLYSTFFEMLPECDSLASSLVSLLNAHIEKEPEDIVAGFVKGLSKTLENDYRRKEHRMLPVLVEKQGFCSDVVLNLVFGEWNSRKIYPEYIDLIRAKKLREKNSTVIHILHTVPGMSEAVMEKFTASVLDVYKNDIGKSDLYSWIDTDKLFAAELKENYPALVKYVKKNIISAAVCEALYDVFKTRVRTDGIQVLYDYAKHNKFVYDCEKYKDVSAYVDMISALESNDDEKAIKLFESLPTDKKVRSDMGGHIIACVIDRKEQTPEETFMLDVISGLLKTEKIAFDTLYKQYSDVFKHRYLVSGGDRSSNAANAVRDGAAHAMKLMTDKCSALCNASDSLRTAVCSESSVLNVAVRSFVAEYGKGVDKWFSSQILSSGLNAELVSYISKVIEANKPQSSSFFSKLFGKR